jgi:uncharacterized cupin superfamily protein
MGYSIVDPDEVDPAPDRPCDLRRLTEAAGLSEMAINRYRADPGEQIPLAYHYHDDQEEAFYVVSGELHVETPEGTKVAGAGHLFAVSPGSPQRAYNPADAEESLEVLAIGAPAGTEEVHQYDPAED